eukprot:4268536-Pleurochrysis_carterae.AAC.1
MACALFLQLDRPPHFSQKYPKKATMHSSRRLHNSRWATLKAKARQQTGFSASCHTAAHRPTRPPTYLPTRLPASLCAHLLACMASHCFLARSRSQTLLSRLSRALMCTICRILVPEMR